MQKIFYKNVLKCKKYCREAKNYGTPDYKDREWFRLDFCYAKAKISCMGCGDTENYAEVRKDLPETVIRHMRACLAKKEKND